MKQAALVARVMWLAAVVLAVWLVMRRRTEGFAGGTPVKNNFPYFVTLTLNAALSRKRVHCTGVLMAPRTVLTSYFGFYRNGVTSPSSVAGPNNIENVAMEIGTVNPEKHSAFAVVYDDFGLGFVILRLARPSQKPPIKIASSLPQGGRTLMVLSKPEYTDSALELAPVKYQADNEMALASLKNDPEVGREEMIELHYLKDDYINLAFGGPGMGACRSDIGAPVLMGSEMAGMVYSATACGKRRKRTYVQFTNMAKLFHDPSIYKQAKALIV